MYFTSRSELDTYRFKSDLDYDRKKALNTLLKGISILPAFTHWATANARKQEEREDK